MHYFIIDVSMADAFSVADDVSVSSSKANSDAGFAGTALFGTRSEVFVNLAD